MKRLCWCLLVNLAFLGQVGRDCCRRHFSKCLCLYHGKGRVLFKGSSVFIEDCTCNCISGAEIILGCCDWIQLIGGEGWNTVVIIVVRIMFIVGYIICVWLFFFVGTENEIGGIVCFVAGIVLVCTLGIFA